ncbi:hypothetical protein AB6A40_007454 [Gnathostoma spinigerum]|uniref:Coronin n=1 Tax=Gnathostoma spinigerum TaxID=75299 RepID=A0ABD6EWV6_9BILA
MCPSFKKNLIQATESSFLYMMKIPDLFISPARIFALQGDCAIRYYEVNMEAPFVHYINTYTTSEPQRGIAFMPKLGIKSTENEINRIYKVTTKGVVDVLEFFVPRKSDLFQADLYPDTRSMTPAMTAEEFIAGKNAPPILTPVNPEAAQALGKPKVHIAKKANILAQLPPSQDSVAVPQQQPQPSTDDHRNHRYSQQPQQDEEPSISRASRRPPVIDDDMGIVRVEKKSSAERNFQMTQSHEPSSSMAPRDQVRLRPRSDRDDGGAQTAGQRRAAAELERIKRTTMHDTDELALPPQPLSSSSKSPRQSVASSGSQEPGSMEELLVDLHKMKSILRQHERRIRLLEDQLADRCMSDTWGL